MYSLIVLPLADEKGKSIPFLQEDSSIFFLVAFNNSKWFSRHAGDIK